MYQPRFYREQMKALGLVSFKVVVKETDLHISADTDLSEQAHQAVVKYRKDLENYVVSQPIFAETFKPYEVPDSAPKIVKAMANASVKVGVGPMASVAGAIAESVGQDLLEYSPQVIVENGGDIFIKTSRPRKFAVYAGESPLNGKVRFAIPPDKTPLGICTSSGTVGHSESLGKADAVVVISPDTSLADAAATAIGNQVKNQDDIDQALKYGQDISGLSGIIIIMSDKMGVWGDIEITQ